MTTNAPQKAVGTREQYSLARILGIWAAAAVPMGILGWVVAPALAPDIAENPCISNRSLTTGRYQRAPLLDSPGIDG